MKLILGLGNTGKAYEGTRHNIGFTVLDEFASRNSAEFKEFPKFKGTLANLNFGGEKVALLKPSTFYNLSGEAARSVMDFYKISPRDVLVVHDELMLPFGTVRTREGGSDAGNNGIKSLSAHVGDETYRIRIGIGNELRESRGDADFVLSHFTSEEKTKLPMLLSTVLEKIDVFIGGKLEPTTHRPSE